MIRTPEWLVRYITFPLYERACGRDTLRQMRRFAADLRLPPDALADLARRRLRRLLAFAGRELPYYRWLFAACNVRPEQDDPYAALQRLPVLDKATVRANAPDMIWAAVPGGFQPAVTGGTSGDTLSFFLDRAHHARNMGARLVLHQRLGVRPGDRRVFLWGSPIEVERSTWRRVRDILLNERIIDAFDLPPRRMDAYLEFIRGYRPRLVYGYGTALALLARHALKRGGPPLPAPRAVILTSDETTPDERAAVQAAFRAPALNEYGSREMGIIAHECLHGALHVLTPLVYVEILRDGQPVPPGEAGQIVCTNLAGRAQPLIRYAQGDFGRLLPGSCTCGSPLPILRLEGARSNGFIVLADGRLCSDHVLMCPTRIDPSIIEFKVYQRAIDRFEVLLVVDERYRPSVSERLREKYREYFGPRVQVNVRLVDRIPPDPSGKRRRFISDVRPADLDPHGGVTPAGELTPVR